MPILYVEMSTALSVSQVAQILPLEVFSIERGGRNTITIADGRIASDLELLEVDELKRIARYELRIANESAKMLSCYVFAVSPQASIKPITCVSVAVLPFSGIALNFDVPLPLFSNYEKITVEIHGDGIELTSDSLPPRREAALFVRRAAIGAFLAFFSAVAVIMGVGQPQILAANAPAAALGGSQIQISYETRGIGFVHIDLLSSDGEVIHGGDAFAGIGNVAINLPALKESRNYLARIEEHNFLGGDTKTLIIRDIAMPSPRLITVVHHAASIDELAVSESDIQSGQLIHVQYHMRATQGILHLLDANDVVWAAAATSKAGTASFTAPHVDEPQTFRVALHAELGPTSADSVVALRVLPAAPPVPRFRPLQGTPLEISSAPMAPGDAVPVRVMHAVMDLHVALQSSDGTELESFNVDHNEFSLHIPPQLPGTKCLLVVSYADRNGQETVILPLQVTSAQKKSTATTKR